MSTPAAAVPREFPSATTIMQAVKLAMELDRAIHFDYFLSTFKGRGFIGENDIDAKNKVLVNSAEEYTSQITKMYKVDADCIILTENSIYIVSGNIKRKTIKATDLKEQPNDSDDDI